MQIISVVLLFLMLIAEGTDAISDENKERLAKMFSPILILTEETRNVYDDETTPIRVTKPEPVSIISAQYADSIRFQARRQRNNLSEYAGGVFDWRSFANWEPPLVFPRVDFSQNRFAFPFRSYRYTGRPVIEGQRYDYGEYTLEAWFDYPGTTAAVWNAAYFGEGAYAGLDNNHRGSNYLNTNTAYVHIDSTTHSNYSGKLFVIQYHYFYPYNDWWNNHEGDWQRIDVVVSSSDPDDDTIEVLGVEYRFHGAWVTYYKNFPNHAGLTSSFDFNPQENLKLSQGTHPVVYVGAGSHAGYPVGGLIDMHDIFSGILEGVGQGAGPDWEYMTHTGKVLSTQADDAPNSDLWESYNLVMLPDPNPNNTNNMGLDPDMSWLGAQIRWGTPRVKAPNLAELAGGNKSPEHGPYNSETNSWGNLNFDRVGMIGFPEDPFEHEDLPYDSYHHWAIIGDETWSGTISLTGDVVVFPGATLTIKPGTLIEVVTNKYDRHEFSLGEGKYYLTEIFVYGTLTTESPLPSMIATAADSILFQRNDPGGSGEAWGGIHVMAGGTATLNSYTRISDTQRGKPTDLTAKVKAGQVGHIELTWTNPNDSSIPQWEYQQKAGSADWGPWMPIPGSTSSTSSHIVEGLTIGVSYQFKVRGLNRTGLAESDPSAAETAAGPPEPPELTVAAGHERVRVRWSPGADNSSPIEQHEWRYKAGAADWDPDWTVYATREQIIWNLDNDTTYTFQMKAKNKVGYSEVVEVQATPRHPIEGPTAISFAENSDDPVASYRFAPAELDQSEVAYRLKLSDIADSGLFELDSQGSLSFQDAPDFETPTDADGDNLYTVWLKAAPVSGNGAPVRRTAPPPTFTKQVDVTVTDADDPGAIELSPLPPQVGVPLTAELTDQDGGITSTTWQWQRRSSPTDAWINASGTSSQPQPSISIYTPQRGDLGDQLQATVEYDDASGTDQTAASDATEAVQAGLPGVPPDFVVSSGRRHVVLRWEAAAANGSPIAQYEFQWREANEANSGQAWPERNWVAVSGGGTARYVMIMELTDGTAYEFAVRAVNGVGDGEPASDTATPGGPVPLWLTASRGDGQVALQWKIPLNAPPIARYEVRQRVSDSGQDWSSWSAVPGGSTARDTTIAGLANGVTYQFEVQAVNSGGIVVGASNPATATPAGLPGVPPNFMPSAGDGQVVLGWEAAAANGSLIKRYEIQWRQVSDPAQAWSSWSPVSGGAARATRR